MKGRLVSVGRFELAAAAALSDDGSSGAPESGRASEFLVRDSDDEVPDSAGVGRGRRYTQTLARSRGETTRRPMCDEHRDLGSTVVVGSEKFSEVLYEANPGPNKHKH